MQLRRILVLGGVTAAFVLAFAAGASAAGSRVSVRVEGKSKTLLARKAVRTHGGSITKGGAPAGVCPATSAAGALDVATHHRWGATFKSRFNDFELASILGEKWPFSQKKYYWGVWVEGRYATTGICEISLKRGDRVLFAVDSDTHHEHPLRLSAPRRAKVGRTFKIKVGWFMDSGKVKPLSGLRIMGAVTKRDGTARITPKRKGKLRLKAERKGYIRSAVSVVSVSS